MHAVHYGLTRLRDRHPLRLDHVRHGGCTLLFERYS
jgi:hypothetical protein